MNKEIYEKNLKSIGALADTWKEFLQEKNKVENKKIEIQAEKSMSGDTIFSVIDNAGKRLYLSGKYNPRAAAEEWIKEKNIKNKNALVIVLGMGDGIFLKEVLQQTNKNTYILVYEPCVDIFIKALQEIELNEVFDSMRVGLAVEKINEEEWTKLLQMQFSLEKFSETYIYINTSYKRLYPEKISKALQEIKKRFVFIQSNWNTVMRYTAYSGINMIKNLKYLLNEYTINSLYHVLPKTFPCIIVAAGPSLNKNIEELKKIQKRACIIACDTAMKPLLSHGIVPDFFLVVDAKKPKMLIDYPGVEKVPFVTTLSVPSEIMDFHTGKKFFYFCGEEIFCETVNAGFKDRKKPVSIKEGVSPLKTGGSVATSAYALAEYMGSEVMILVGQDLAFTDNKSHADGTFDDKMEEVEGISIFPQVEGVDGKKLYTAPDMKAYLKWYEDEIAEHPEYKVIDATEGGALIKGTEIIKLADAIDKYCYEEIDIQEHLEHLPKLFREEETEYVKKYFGALPEKAKKLLIQINRTKCEYQRLGKMVKQKKNTGEIVKLSKKLSEEIEKLEENEVYLLMVGFMAGYEYTLRATLNQENEDEMFSFIRQGEVYLENMGKILKLIIPMLEELKR